MRRLHSVSIVSAIRSTNWLVLALCGLAVSAEAGEVHRYVATNGNDVWSGTLAASNSEGTDGPFATLAKAQDELRTLKAAGQTGDGATVFVRGGTYELHETLTWGPEDSGTAEAPVIYRAYEDEKPVLLGARRVTGFKPWKDEILQCDLKGTPLEGVTFRQLFFRGKPGLSATTKVLSSSEHEIRARRAGSGRLRRMEMARYPNVDSGDPHFGEWAHVLAVDGPGVKDHFTCTDDVIKTWTNVGRAEVCIHPAYGWAWNIVPIKTAHREEQQVTLARNVSYNLHVGDRYFVRNLLEELDAPGEWYLDGESSTLYFWPPDGNVQDGHVPGEVWAPVTGTVAAMKGASHVTLRGFTIEACGGDAVQIHDCHACLVAQSVIRNCGAWGVSVRGGHRSGASGNDISETGAGGIALDGGDLKTLEHGDNFATNNYIHHIAEFQRTYNTGVNVRGMGNTAGHNLIHDCYHQGILMGGSENRVEYNIVHHTNLGSEDTGGIYMSSRNYLSRGNVIRHNIFHHVGGFGKASSWTPVRNGRVKFEYPHFTWGIYLDAPETGVHVYGNVLYSVPVCGMFNHSGKDNTWENNIVVDCPGFRASVWGRGDLFVTSWNHVRQAKKEGYWDRYVERYPELRRYDENELRANTMFNCKFVRNIVYYTKEGGKWMRERNKGAWQDGQLVWTYAGHRDDFPEFEFDHNCVWSPDGIDPKFQLTLAPEPGKLLSWAEWKATGKDEHSLFADPLFVDSANHDYRLRPDSPALKIGFQQIPFDEIGPFQDELRASWPIVEAPGVAALGDFTTERFFQLPGYGPTKAREFVPRGGVPNLAAKLKAKAPVTIACFAGGSHAQGGWFRAFMEDLRKRHPGSDIRSILADIHGGARGSQFSLYRFRHEVLRHKPDLIFVDFASDDTESDPHRMWPVVEGVIRQALRANPNMDLVFVYAFKIEMESDYAKGLCPSAVSAYEKLADHYGVASVNMGYRIAQMARDGKLVVRATQEEAKQLDGQPVFTHDGVNTSGAAKQQYALIMSDRFQELLDGAGEQSRPADSLSKPFRADHLERATQIPITESMLSGKWERRDPGPMAKHFEAIWFTNTPGAKLTFRFRGTAVSLFNLMGPDTGRARITIDGNDRGVREQIDRWCFYQRLSALQVAAGLQDKEHAVTVELLPDPPDRTAPADEAKKLGRYDPSTFQGVALRIGWIRIVGEPVD